MSGYTSNAAAARARALYGKRLRESDYKSMCSAKSVGEVAAYLSGTKYRSAFSLGNYTAVHREQIEMLSGGQVFKEFLSLVRFLPSGGGYLGTYLLARAEQKEIMDAVMRVYTSHISNSQYDSSRQDFSFHKTKLKIYMLRRANTYSDILSATKNSVYYSAMLKYVPADDGQLQISFIEAELWNVIYRSVFEQIQKTTSGKEREYTVNFFKKHIDTLNYITARRMKLYPDCSADFIKKLMISGGSFSQKRLDAMATAKDRATLYEIMQSTHLKSQINSDGEESASSVYLHEYMKNLRYSPYPELSVMSYLFLAEIEISNITKITEGIRYSLDYRDIYKMLIIPK